MVVDHEVDGAQRAPGGSSPKTDGCTSSSASASNSLELVRRERAHVDAERVDHRAVLGPRDLAEGDQRRGRTLATEQRAQRVAGGDAVGIGIGLQQDPELLARLRAARASPPRGAGCRGASNSSSMSSRISERRPRAQQAAMRGQLVVVELDRRAPGSGACGAASRTATSAARTKPRSSETIAKIVALLESSFSIASAERPPGSARKPGGRKRASFSRGTQLSSSSGREPIWLHKRACSAPSHRMTRVDK